MFTDYSWKEVSRGSLSGFTFLLRSCIDYPRNISEYVFPLFEKEYLIFRDNTHGKNPI